MSRAPANLRRLILTGAAASSALWETSVDNLLNREDAEHKAIKEGLARCEPGSAEYGHWTQKFYDLHMLIPARMPNFQLPDDFLTSGAALEENPLVNKTM